MTPIRTTRRRTVATIAAVSAAAVVGVGVGVAVSTGDPVRPAEASRLENIVVAPADPAATDGGVSSDPTTSDGRASGAAPDSAPSAGRTITVDGLQQVSGTLVRGEDVDDWYVAGIDLDFGPDLWLVNAGPTADFDGDGTAEPLLAELDGLVGRETTFGVRFDDGYGDEGYGSDDGYGGERDAYVFTIAGKVYWDPASTAPWVGASSTATPTPTPANDVTVAVDGEISRDQAIARAEAALGDGAVAVDVWEEFEDAYRWEIDVLAADGREYDVRLDAAGRVLDVRLD